MGKGSKKKAKAVKRASLPVAVASPPTAERGIVTPGMAELYWRTVGILDVKCADGDGRTPLHVFAGDAEKVRLLLLAGANADVRDAENATPLHEAVRWGEIGSVRALAEAGADINAKGPDDETPLHLAARGGDKDIAALLIRAGAEINARSTHGVTPLLIARDRGHEAIVRALQSKGGSE